MGRIYEVVIDVTYRYRDRHDRPLNREWTEVLLIGHDDQQDTVAKLLPDATRKNWLIRQINQRFYRFPPGFVVRNADASSGQSNPRVAHGLEQITLNWSTGDGEGQHEDVQVVHPVYGPVTVRYFKLKGSYGVDDAVGNSRAKTMEAYGVGSRGDHICIVWRNECYEIRTGWSQISGAFGVTFGSANVAIQILLLDDAPVKNNTYRDKIIRQEESGHYVALEEFADLVCQYRPQWLIDYVEAEANRNNSDGNVMERLRQFLQELMVTGDDRPVVEPGGPEQGEMRRGGGRTGGGGGGGTEDTGNRPAQARRTSQTVTGIPDVQFATDPAIREEMSGRAAVYRRAENMVLLNPDHFLYQRDLQRLYEDVGPDSERQQLARQFYNEEYRYQAGKFHPLKLWGDVLLDGHKRLAICRRYRIPFMTEQVALPDRSAALLWVEEWQLGRYDLSDDQRAAIAVRVLRRRGELKSLPAALPTNANGRRDSIPEPSLNGSLRKPSALEAKASSYAGVAKEARVSEHRVRSAVQLYRADQELFRLVVAGEKRLDAARKELVARRRQADRLAIASTVQRLAPQVRAGDFRSVLSDLPDNSVDLIFTDPPYDTESVPLYGDLARFAARVLVPGGSLICYAGIHALPALFPLMTPHLTFWWQLCLRLQGSFPRLHGWRVHVHYKPLLWFVKVKYKGEYMVDVIEFDVVGEELARLATIRG